jgi:HAD superfamily hydrolase (TIGR01450 family)
MNKSVIFDLDGTIYFGNTLADGALEVIQKLKYNGYQVLYFTNNSTKTRQEICNKLINLGLNVIIFEVYTSSFATAKYLNEKKINNVFLIGTNGFKKELKLFDINIVSEKESEAVVVGLDINFNYETISKALIAVSNGAKIIASNIDMNYPSEKGILKPGSNAIVSSIIGASGAKVDYVVGKPNKYLLEIIVNDFNLDKSNMYVVGDSIDSDIAMANNYGCKSILVGHNSNSLEDVANIILDEKDINERIRI